MFPYANYSPSLHAQPSSHAVITPLVGRNLVDPVITVGVRNPTMLWATMPKATINKKCDPLLWEGKVRLSL